MYKRQRLYSLFTYHELDVAAMRQAAAFLEGEHDFASFCQAGAQVETTVRTIYSLEVVEEGRDLVIRVCGNGFLYNMVRIIAGTLLEVGRGRRKPAEMADVLEVKDRSAAGPTAPAHALTSVSYTHLDVYKRQLCRIPSGF